MYVKHLTKSATEICDEVVSSRRYRGRQIVQEAKTLDGHFSSTMLRRGRWKQHEA